MILVLFKGILLALDPHARFLFGDSNAYLLTGFLDRLPGDRSWTYGVILEGLRRVWPHTGVIIGVNVAAFAGAQLLMGRWLRRAGASVAGVAGFYLVSSLVPALLYYERAVLTDTMALAAFIAMLAAAAGNLLLLPLLAFLVVSLRSAYLPVLLGLLPVLLFLLSRPRPAAAGLILAGVLAFAWANGAVMHGPPTFNKMGPRFLLGILSPALDCPAMRRVDPGFDCALLSRWQVADYHKRDDNIWHDDGLIAYTQTLARARGVEEAAIQGPVLADLMTRRLVQVAVVYGRTGWAYLDPRPAFDPAVINHDNIAFPAGFLAQTVHPRWRSPWAEGDATRPSFARTLLTRAQVLDWLALLAGLLGSAAAVARWRRLEDSARLMAAGTLLYAAGLPLFSAEMNARYAMPLCLAGVWWGFRACVRNGLWTPLSARTA